MRQIKKVGMQELGRKEDRNARKEGGGEEGKRRQAEENEKKRTRGCQTEDWKMKKKEKKNRERGKREKLRW